MGYDNDLMTCLFMLDDFGICFILIGFGFGRLFSCLRLHDISH